MFTVCLAAPPGHAGLPRLLEQAGLIHAALRALGAGSRLALGSPQPGRINILVGWHLFDPAAIAPGTVTICRQLEPLSPEFFDERPAALEILAGAREIWDYAPANVAFLARLGLAAKLVAPGYHECLESGPADAAKGAKDADVLFCGEMTGRREELLGACVKLGLRVLTLNSAAPGDFDQALARSRLALCLHQDDRSVFDGALMAKLWANAAVSVVEKPGRYPYPGVPLYASERGFIPAAIERRLERYEESRVLAKEARRQFRRLYPMAKLLWRALDPRLLASVRLHARFPRREPELPAWR